MRLFYGACRSRLHLPLRPRADSRAGTLVQQYLPHLLWNLSLGWVLSEDRRADDRIRQSWPLSVCAPRRRPALFRTLLLGAGDARHAERTPALRRRHFYL